MGEHLKLGIVSDTHGLVRPELLALLEGVDAILHAGDVGDEEVIWILETIAPVHAVTGNVDGLEYPERLEVAFMGRRFGLTHGHLVAPKDRTRALLNAFPDADFVIYGHTHVPKFEKIGKTTVLNPGSAGAKRFRQPVTAGILELTPEDYRWSLHDFETGQEHRP
jgi:putative phosphoesterase